MIKREISPTTGEVEEREINPNLEKNASQARILWREKVEQYERAWDLWHADPLHHPKPASPYFRPKTT